MSKPRLFVDMDGTLAEFRKLHIDVDELEDIQTTQERLQEILRTPGYFRSLNPQTNVVEAVRRLAEGGEVEVFVITCYLEHCSALYEKNEWLDEYLSVIDKEHRIFVPDGKNKSCYVPGYVNKNDFLLDDYTYNLCDWNVFGTGIKLLNGINNTNGSWKYSALRYDKTPEELANDILRLIKDKSLTIIDSRPQDKPDLQEEYER